MKGGRKIERAANNGLSSAKDISLSDPYEELDFDQAEQLVRKRQRFHRRPKRMADVIARLMARKGYGQQQSADEIRAAWNVIAGDQWQSQTRVGVIRRGVLEVIVGNSVLNQRLEFEKRRLLTELRKQLPQVNINDIRFRIGNVN